MRVDKFLKNARIIKRRSVAKEACDGGRIAINEKRAKAGDQVAVGDTISIRFGDKERNVQVLELLDHAPKDRALDMYGDL